MSERGIPVERLRAFLGELRPEARELLMRELETAASRGEELPAAAVILAELRRLRQAEEPAVRTGTVAELLTDTFKPFVFEGETPYKVQGRIQRSAFDSICTWLTRSVLTGEFEPSTTAGPRLATEFAERIVAEIDAVVGLAQESEKAKRRLAGQIAVSNPIEELVDFRGVLDAQATLAQISARLPLRIKNLADDQLEHVTTVLCSPSVQTPQLFPYALVLLMSKLAFSWQLIRFAVKATDSDVASRVAETPYGLAVSIVLAEIERAVVALAGDFSNGRTSAALVRVKDIHDALRGVRTELDLSGDSPWSRQLAAIRASVSHLVRSEIELVPGHIRRLLRIRTADQELAGGTIDPSDVAEIEGRLDLLSVCRTCANELALNEATLRIHADVQNYLETNTSALVERLRASGHRNRGYCRSQIDAAVRFCGKVFDPNYASLLAKAADVAYNSERKAAKA